MPKKGKLPAGVAPSDRRGGEVVPGPSTSSTSVGLPGELPTRSPGESVSVREEGGDTTLPHAAARTTARRPSDWVPNFLPRYSEIVNGSVNWKEYYDQVWQLEQHLAKTVQLEQDCAEYRQKVEDFDERFVTGILKRELAKKAEEWTKLAETVQKDTDKEWSQRMEEKEQEWETYADGLQEENYDLKETYEALVKECKKAKVMQLNSEGKYIYVGKGKGKEAEQESDVEMEKETRDQEVQTRDRTMDIEIGTTNQEVQTEEVVIIDGTEERDKMDVEGLEEIDMDRTIQPGRITQATEKEGRIMDRLGQLEGEVQRMANVVTLLAETLTLQGERLTGEMSSIRECVHSQWRMGGGIPLTSEEEEGEACVPLPTLPSAVCGAPKGGRPAGGGGRGKRKRIQAGDGTGVSPPAQQRRVGSPDRASDPGPAASTPRLGGPVRPPPAAVHPPVSRGHPAAVEPIGPKGPVSTPRGAAIVIRGRAEGFSYAEALRKAKKEVPLGELGIPGAKTRRTAGGDLLVEVQGPAPDGGVDALVGRLKSLLPDASVRKVETFGEVRLVGFDESVLPEELAEALAGRGGCEPALVRIGAPRFLRGEGSAWARLPLGAAQAAVRAGKFGLGWSVVRVNLLGPRPLQCHKCWGYGHVSATCPRTEVDRSRTCYRCGVPGHMAAGCAAAPFCAACDSAGLFARHRMGSAACTLANRAREGRGGRTGRRRGRPPAGRASEGGETRISGPPPSENPPPSTIKGGRRRGSRLGDAERGLGQEAR